MDDEKVLVVAFDGMDKELIEKFDLENIKQEEYGSIDNSTGISRRMTSELFASFITGETFEKHGIEGLETGVGLWDRFVDYIVPSWLERNFRGIYTLKNWLRRGEAFESRKFTKSDLDVDSIFEEIDASLPLYVPSYNPDPTWLLGYPHQIVRYYDTAEWVENTEWHTKARLRHGIGSQPAFFDISKGFWDIVMLHLHDPDSFQDTKLGDLEEQYNRLDRIAGEILEEFENWTVIFMSDHGRPLEKSGPHDHNENAFYSSNEPLFDQEPHITDFHDKIIDMVEKGS